MLDAVRAEALKLARHRATWLLVWIYPIALTVVTACILAYHAFSPIVPGGPAESAAGWISSSTVLWKAPRSGAGRFLIAGFAALVFAGEYGWNTWKLVIPARVRWQLIMAKWVVAMVFVLAAFIAADLIVVTGSWLATFEGDRIPAGVTLGAVVQAHWRAIGTALLPIVYTIAFTGLFAILTQSLLAAMILSIVMIVVEGLLPLLAVLGHNYAPWLTLTLVKTLPFYHINNVNAWAKGAGMTLPLGPDAMVAMAWSTSCLALLAWIAAAGAGTLWRFVRQDLN